MTKLRHEHIIRLLEVVFSKDDGSLCFVFEVWHRRGGVLYQGVPLKELTTLLQYVESNVFRVITAARHWREAALGGGGLPSTGVDAASADALPPCSLETGSGLSEACIRRIMGQLLSGLSFMASQSGGGAGGASHTARLPLPPSQHRHGFFHRDLCVRGHRLLACCPRLTPSCHSPVLGPDAQQA